MKLSLSEEALSIALEALENQHRDLLQKADGWSHDLEGNYDNYLKYRQDELNLAAVINSLKKQRTSQQQNGVAAEKTLAEWEIELLSGKSLDT